jgi:hypothetical protein
MKVARGKGRLRGKQSKLTRRATERSNASGRSRQAADYFAPGDTDPTTGPMSPVRSQGQERALRA